jgi:hypothetical protein
MSSIRRLSLVLVLLQAAATLPTTAAAAAASTTDTMATMAVAARPALRGTTGRRLPHPVVLAGANEVSARMDGVKGYV